MSMTGVVYGNVAFVYPQNSLMSIVEARSSFLSRQKKNIKRVDGRFIFCECVNFEGYNHIARCT